jgi:hypothetical protein
MGVVASLLALVGSGCRSEHRAAAEPHGAPIARVKPGALAAAARDAICMTRGNAASGERGLRITDATTRGVATASSGEAAALRFTYLGPSDDQVQLASGQVRHQIGIKLRAADGCNVVYVMWRVEPKPFVEVSVKVNPGMRTHAECGARGYTKVKPAASSPVPGFEVGVEHVLEAAIDGDTLTAKLDGEIVWQGDLPDAARTLDGPAGFRSDNVTYDAELSVAPAARGHVHATPGCAGGEGDD